MSPRLQFLARVYMTPAALIACTKDVSLVAVNERREGTRITFNITRWLHFIFMRNEKNKINAFTSTYLVSVLWVELRCRGSSIYPRQTGVCTPVLHSVPPSARSQHILDGPARWSRVFVCLFLIEWMISVKQFISVYLWSCHKKVACHPEK